MRDINEDARDVARTLAKTEVFERSCRDRKRVEMLFAHLKRILRLGRLHAGSPSSLPDRRHHLRCALRKRRVRQCLRVEAAVLSGATAIKKL